MFFIKFILVFFFFHNTKIKVITCNLSVPSPWWFCRRRIGLFFFCFRDIPLSPLLSAANLLSLFIINQFIYLFLFWTDVQGEFTRKLFVVDSCHMKRTPGKFKIDNLVLLLIAIFKQINVNIQGLNILFYCNYIMYLYLSTY